MKVCEIFEGIQGEGKYIGQPALFIRLSGCTRNCSFCDTKYHIKGKQLTIDNIVQRIRKSKLCYVVWTGGEPMLQQDEIYEVIHALNDGTCNHLETNGDILPQNPTLFNYICFSPKEKRTLDNVYAYVQQLELSDCFDWDIKIVTDLELNKDMIKYASILMPLSTDDKNETLENQKKVWNYCVKNDIKYTPRIHRDVWGDKIGV